MSNGGRSVQAEGVAKANAQSGGFLACFSASKEKKAEKVLSGDKVWVVRRKIV